MKNFYIISQNKSYQKEIEMNCIWCPKTNKDGSFSQYYENVKNIRKGDIIFSHYKNKIASIGIAISDCYEAVNDIDRKVWNLDGYKVDIYYLPTNCNKKLVDHFDEFKKFQDNKYAPFNINGKSNQAYAYHISEEFAFYFINLFLDDGIKLLNQLTGQESEVEYISDEDHMKMITVEEENGITIKKSYKVQLSKELEQLKRNKELGDAGELFIIQELKKELGDIDEKIKDELIQHVSNSSDSDGYDILKFKSIEDKKASKNAELIEVKTTNLDFSQPFFLSENEYKTAKQNTNSYFIYRVYNFKETPTYKKIKFDDIFDKDIKPCLFKVKL